MYVTTEHYETVDFNNIAESRCFDPRIFFSCENTVLSANLYVLDH